MNKRQDCPGCLGKRTLVRELIRFLGKPHQRMKCEDCGIELYDERASEFNRASCLIHYETGMLSEED